MALIAFCAIALVENVTNAHPVGRGEEGGMVGQLKGGGGGQRGRRKRRRREDKKEQKQDKRFGHIVVIKKTQTEIDTENSSQVDNSVLGRCGNNSRKTSTVS